MSFGIDPLYSYGRACIRPVKITAFYARNTSREYMVYAYTTMPDFVGLEEFRLAYITNSETTCQQYLELQSRP